MSDDLETGDLLAMIEAHAARRPEVLAGVLAAMDAPELRRAVNRLCALVDLRGRVGTDQPDTPAWCQWLRAYDGLVL